MSDVHDPDAVRQFLASVRDANGLSLRQAAERMPRGRELSRTSLGDRLSGKHQIQDVGELDALVVAFGESREDRARARTLYRSRPARTARKTRLRPIRAAHPRIGTSSEPCSTTSCRHRS